MNQKAIIANIANMHETLSLLEKNDKEEVEYWEKHIAQYGGYENIEEVKGYFRNRLTELHKKLN